MKPIIKYPDCVPADVVEFYAARIEKSGPFALPDDAVYQDREPKQQNANVQTSYSVAFECLEFLMRSPSMKSAWVSVGRYAEQSPPRKFAEQMVSLITSHLNPFPLGTIDDAERMRKASEKLDYARKLIGISDDADNEFLGRGYIKNPDGTTEVIFESKLRQWFRVPPTEAISNLVEWLNSHAATIENLARDGTAQPKSPRAPTQKLITRLSELMHELYGRPLDDTVASTAEIILAFFGSDEIITRERVMQSRKPTR